MYLNGINMYFFLGAVACRPFFTFITFRSVWPFPRSYLLELGEIPPERGEGPLVYEGTICLTSNWSHSLVIFALFWVEGCTGSDGGHVNAVVCVCTSVLCLYRVRAQNSILSSRG